MPTYIIESITWGDGEYETDAAREDLAASKHALDGWENAEAEATPIDESPKIGDREPVDIRVTTPGGASRVYRVRWAMNCANEYAAIAAPID